MKYSCSKDIQSNFKDTKNKVRQALMDIEFNVLTEINMKDVFKIILIKK